MPATVLIADDEPEIHELLTPYLARGGFSVADAYSGPDALRIAASLQPAAILLDVMLPGQDGMEVCRQLRRSHDCPILFISARGGPADKVQGLGLGGDDYISKPFSPAEVVARVKAQVRRHDRQAANAGPCDATAPLVGFPPTEPLRLGDVVIQPDSASLLRADGGTVQLTALELRLLLCLAAQPGRIFTKRQLYEHAWDAPYMGDDNTVMVAIRRLRNKVEVNPDRPRLIQTVRGLGYRATRAAPAAGRTGDLR